MKRILLLMMCVLSVSFAFAQKSNQKRGIKTVKVAKSEVRWWGHKVVRSDATTHSGFVKMKNGKFIFKNLDLVGGEFTVDMRTLEATDLTGEDQKKLTDDLKSSNFFEVKKFPVAKFVIKRILQVKNDDYNYEVIGDITIKGIRKTISFPAHIRTNGLVAELESAKFSLNRQDFKVFYKSSIKDYLIKDEIDLKIKASTH